MVLSYRSISKTSDVVNIRFATMSPAKLKITLRSCSPRESIAASFKYNALQCQHVRRPDDSPKRTGRL